MIMAAVYGPVPSRRLGVSLGIDPICSTKGDKKCSFDCVYCQLFYGLGPTQYRTDRKVFVDTENIRRELKIKIERTNPDIITISGTGEPTLAENLGEIAYTAKELSSLPLAVLTNASLLSDEKVRKDLDYTDTVIATLDAPNQQVLEAVNRPAEGIRYESLVEGLKRFKQEYKGEFCLQMMFIDLNKSYAAEMAEIARSINPDKVYINTPRRKSPVRPLAKDELDSIKQHFTDLDAVSIYELEEPDVEPLNRKETLKRRPGA